MSSGIGTEPYGIVKVSANRFNVIDTRTGKVLTITPKTKRMAGIEARGRNLIHGRDRWCAANRYESEFAPAILCGATVPANSDVCPRAHQHVNQEI